MKYKILFDFGSEGLKLEKDEFDLIDSAVKRAMVLNRSYCSPFLIITVVDWKAIGFEN